MVFPFFLSVVDPATAGLKEGRKHRERAFLPNPGFRSLVARSLEELLTARQAKNVRYCLTPDIGLCLTKVEVDADLHLALQDATGAKAGIVVCEIPAKQEWCSIRETVFSWTRTRFPLHIQSTRKLTVNGTPVVTMIGKAFWDIGHAPADQSNRRTDLQGYAAWEIHPVMMLTVQ